MHLSNLLQEHFLWIFVRNVTDHQCSSTVSLDSIRNYPEFVGLLAGYCTSLALGHLSLIKRTLLRIISIRIADLKKRSHSICHLHFWVGVCLSGTSGKRVKARVYSGCSFLFFLSGIMLRWCQYMVALVVLTITIKTLKVPVFIERLKIAKNLANFFLLHLFYSVILDGFCFSTAWGGKDHVFNQLINTLAICVIEYPTNNTLEKSFILKFEVFIAVVVSSSLMPMGARTIIFLPFLFGLGSDKAIDVCLRRIKLQGGVITLY